MRLSRTSRLIAATIVLFSILFMQLAVSAYACPVLKPGYDDQSTSSVQVKQAENPEKEKQAKEKEEIHQKLLNDNQIQAAISVLKGIKVYQKLDNASDAPVHTTNNAESNEPSNATSQP